MTPTVLTCGREGSRALEPQARALAERCSLRFVPRRERTLERLAADEGSPVVAVLARDGLVLWREGIRLRFAAGLAEVRIKRLAKGEREPLLALGEIRPGDRVIDCTLGLARDALVMAAAGAQVDGLESRAVLAGFAEVGLARLPGEAGRVAPRVRAIRADYREHLPRLSDGAYEVVYFDPMFVQRVEAPPELELFRALADARPLDAASVRQACRVARRAVIVKDGPAGLLLRALGIPARSQTRGNRVRFGKIDAVGGQACG